MNTRVRITIIIVLVSATTIVLLTHRNVQPVKQERPPELVAAPAPPPDPLAGRKSRLPQYPGNLRPDDMTPEQRATFAKLFTNQLKPALQKWCSVYQGRLPFNPDDVRLDNFKIRLGFEGGSGSLMYGFVTDNGTTLTIADKNGNAYVMQMMAKGAATALNAIPDTGTMPNLSVPVTKDQVIKWVQADTGSQFPPAEVQIRPTGLATPIQGGAFVDLGGNSYSRDAYQFTGTNVQFVFSQDGNIMNYERDPLR